MKLRGYRIELGEIQAAINSIKGIVQSCVLAKERITDTANVKYLVAYYIQEEGSDLSNTNILEYLTNLLPDYMVPSYLIALDSFPLTINGKLDKKALPDPDFNIAIENYIAPSTDMELAICTIWEETLGLDRIGITDDFFKIGGNSILAIKVSHRMSHLLDSDIKVSDIFKLSLIHI